MATARANNTRRKPLPTAAAAPCSPHGVPVVWLKRDLRLADHEPLVAANQRGAPLVLYVFEPEVLGHPETDAGQVGFTLDSLRELAAGLRARGGQLTVRRGAMPDVLAALHQELAPAGGIAAVYSHQETGNRVTFDRDRRVAAWLQERGIPWHESCQDGVVRRLPSRDGWARRWQTRMTRAQLPAPARLDPVEARPGLRGFDHGALPTLAELGLPPTTVVDRQIGGIAAAEQLLQTFLHERGETYRTAMSSPLLGWDACSRLSPHFAHGTISLKTVYQALLERQEAVRRQPRTERGLWPQALQSYGARLRWHCHFLQKLEDEPDLEFHNLNRAFDGLREADFDAERFAAFTAGRTGYPMVDACVRCLKATGWLNFRMRAMLASFAAYHLWLHWRPTGQFLARCFVDLEPGIHWSQMQMQSGVTGINTVRIYSPEKQLRDQDPDGRFVRQWVPELAGVPTRALARPDLLSPLEQAEAGCRIGRDYPAPIVEAAAAVQLAKQRIYAARRTPAARAEAQRVYDQHGSRKRPRRRPPARSRTTSATD